MDVFNAARVLNREVIYELQPELHQIDPLVWEFKAVNVHHGQSDMNIVLHAGIGEQLGVCLTLNMLWPSRYVLHNRFYIYLLHVGEGDGRSTNSQWDCSRLARGF